MLLHASPVSPTEKMKSWRVLLGESRPAFRPTIVEMLAMIPGVSVVARVGNGWDVMFTSSQVKPDIILLDLNLPGLNGLEVTGLIKRGLPETPVVILLDGAEERHVRAVEESGACAYLLKSKLAQELPSLLARLELCGIGDNSSS